MNVDTFLVFKIGIIALFLKLSVGSPNRTIFPFEFEYKKA